MLLLAYAELTGHTHNGFELCSAEMDRFIERQVGSRSLSLYGGWTELGWIAAHLGAEEDFVSEHVDRLLIGHLQKWPVRAGYDLISGLVGAGVYCLERMPLDAGRKGMSLVVDALDSSRIETESGVTWFTPPGSLPEWQRRHAPDGYYNLGVAHGVPGVIGLLGRCCAEDVESQRARGLARAAVSWLRRQQPDPTMAELPSWIAPGVRPDPGRRMAWCYGPLGVAAVVLQAAKRIGDEEGERWARSLAHACAAVPPEQGRTMDAGLCHGAAGNLQIFRRIFEYTGEAVFQQAADAWLQQTLAYWQPGVGVGGFQAWSAPEGEEPGWEEDASFLSGSAGVGLALLGATTKVETAWDRLLLLS